MTGSSREAVLAAIRQAQESGRRTPTAVPDAPAYHTELGAGVDRVELLTDRLIDYRATVINVCGGGAGAVARAASAALAALGIDRVVVPPGLPAIWFPEGMAVTVDNGLDVHALDSAPASVTSSAAAVAVTGTILLDHGPEQGRRALSLVPDTHVCLVHVDRVFGELPEALRALGPRQIMTWISGPSATSDIELVRVEGVHGPRNLIVIIHGESP